MQVGSHKESDPDQYTYGSAAVQPVQIIVSGGKSSEGTQKRIAHTSIAL